MSAAGMAGLFSRFISPTSTLLVGSGLSVVPLQEPRTEYHLSLSGCSGRSPSPGNN